MTPSTAETSSTARAREKGTLFCQSCWHESPADGDWRVQATPDGDRYRCPNCGATVADRSGRPAVLATPVSNV